MRIEKNPVGYSSFTIARIINTAIIWASTQETLSSGGLRTTQAQTSLRRPACASAQSDQRLFIRFLESIICKLAAGEISFFKLVSIAEETGLKHSLSTPSPGDRFSHNEAHMIPNNLVFSEKKYPRKNVTHQAFLHFTDMEEGIFFRTTQLTHISLTSFLWGIGKQCRTR